MLALLTLLAVVAFAAVGGLSRAFHRQQDFLGNRWFSRGLVDLKAQRFDAAVPEFRAALRYAPDSYPYQLNLAEALVGSKRTGEAQAYFINLWERQPEDGLVNLELARIAAQQQETQQALRYYHNAIYATWPGDAEVQRRDARLELIEFLMHINARAQAQSEMIALAANLGEDATQQAQMGELFLRAKDYEHALAAFRVSLRSDRHNRTALAGAGLAAFELGLYPAAQHYLQAAVSTDPGDEQSATNLKMTDLVLQNDPFQRGISAAQRDRIIVEAFATAGERLKNCGTVSSAAASSLATLTDAWTKMKPQISPMGLRRNPDLAEPAMDMVFNIERQTSAVCGNLAGTDLALLLIAKLHEGN